jgi:hypothetical protein
MNPPRAKTKPAPSTTYQEVLDEALRETFPASDPIAVGAAAHASLPTETQKDTTDWLVRPGSKVPRSSATKRERPPSKR